MTATDALISQLGIAYDNGKPWAISKKVVDRFRDQVEHWFSKIPVPVRWLIDYETKQPFSNADDMRKHAEKYGELLMLSEGSLELGRDLYSKHRAVHDWFGHIEPGNPFGGLGETKSFLSHLDHYTPDVLPIVFSDVVLSNCYWQHFGRGYGKEKWVYTPALIQRVRQHFGK